MKCINLWAGPGAGKSTTASGLFFEMKTRDMEVELVTEYAKKLVWQKRHNTLKDQLYVTAKQNSRMMVLQDQVNWCITDSPLLLGLYYMPNYHPLTFPTFALELFNSYDNLNIWINRTKKYNPNGRNQNEQEARQADDDIKQLLIDNNLPFVEVDGDAMAPKRILETVLAQGKYT